MLFSSVRELQPDARELNQAELPEVDPEENSAEFMGILIKVGIQAMPSTLCSIHGHMGGKKNLYCCHFISGTCQIEKNLRDHQGHNGAAGTRAETDRQAVHHSDSRPCLSERGKPAKVEETAGMDKSSPRGPDSSWVFCPTGRHYFHLGFHFPW